MLAVSTHLSESLRRAPQTPSAKRHCANSLSPPPAEARSTRSAFLDLATMHIKVCQAWLMPFERVLTARPSAEPEGAPSSFLLLPRAELTRLPQIQGFKSYRDETLVDPFRCVLSLPVVCLLRLLP